MSVPRIFKVSLVALGLVFIIEIVLALLKAPNWLRMGSPSLVLGVVSLIPQQWRSLDFDLTSSGNHGRIPAIAFRLGVLVRRLCFVWGVLGPVFVLQQLAQWDGWLLLPFGVFFVILAVMKLVFLAFFDHEAVDMFKQPGRF